MIGIYHILADLCGLKVLKGLVGLSMKAYIAV